MYPIMGRYGPFFLYSYNVVMGAGLLGAIWLASRGTAVEKQRPAQAAILIVAGALLLGRLGFLLSNAAYFAQEPLAIAQLWQGGFHYHAAIIGGLGGLWLWCWRHKRPFTPSAAPFALPLLFMHSCGWFACYLEGCGYGRQTTLHPFAADLPDSFGVFALRYQTQLLAVAVYLLFFILLFRYHGRFAHGSEFWAALLSASVVEGLLSFWRGDLRSMSGGQTLFLIFCIIFAILSLFRLQFRYRIRIK
jgi:phosphatidylglycerol:prolipoprotein diacylglycerol transferase